MKQFNILIGQQSPIERLKVNLYDDERIQYQNASNQQNTPLNNNIVGVDSQQNINLPSIVVSQNLNNNNPTKKNRPPFRRRSCYCNQTGKQSQKSQRIDFLFPTSFIKNMIYIRMKKKQDQKINHSNEKDLIIQNLNRTFDIQDKSGRASVLNSPRYSNQNYNFNDQSPHTGGRKTPATGKYRTFLNTQQNHVQKSQFSNINSPKAIGGLQTSNFKPQNVTQEKPTGEELNSNIVNVQKENQTPLDNQEKTIQHIKTFSEISNNIKNENIIKQPQIETIKNSEKNQVINKQMTVQCDSQSIRSNKKDIADMEVNVNRPPKKSVTSSRNSPRNSYIGSPLRQQTPNSSKKSSIYYGSNTNYYNHQNSSGRKQSNQQEQVPLIEKKNKLFAKLRIATKIVGIQERQRKKSLLYTQDYYSALQEIANNVAEQEEVEQKDANNSNQEKKLTLVRKIKNDQKNIRAPTTVNQIIDAHNLRFNSTLNSFIDKRAKSYNTLLINPTEDFNSLNSTNKKRGNLVSPFKTESYSNKNEVYYLKTEPTYQRTDGYYYPSPMAHSPIHNKGYASYKQGDDKQPQQLYQSYLQNNKKSQRKLNETDRQHTSRNASQKQVSSFTLSQFPNQKQATTSQLGLDYNYKYAGLNNSDESLDSYLINGHSHSKQNFRQKSNNEDINQVQPNQKSSNELNSYDQIGKYDAYFASNSKQSKANSNFKAVSKTQKKFELLVNSQPINKDSYLIQSPHMNKDNQNTSRSINQYSFNNKTSSHPNLLYSQKKELSTIQNNTNSLKTQSQQNNLSHLSSKLNYTQVKFENKNRRSIIQSEMI